MKCIISIALGLVIACLAEAKAGEPLTNLSLGRAITHSVTTPVKRQTTIFYELMGMSGSLVNLNIEQRFQPGMDGLGWRAGVGYGFPAVTVPVGLNYLMGKQKHYFELGLGTTFIFDFHASSKDNSQGFCLDVSGSATVGYRYQPTSGRGLTWGAGFAPLLNKEAKGWNFVPYIPYLRVGYTL